MKLTDYFLKKRVSSLAAQAAKRKHAYCTLKAAGSIFVLYDVKDSESVELCLETLRMMGKRVTCCVYCDDQEDLPKMDDSYIYVSKNTGLDRWYFPHQSTLLAVNEVKADILIDLTRGENSVMQYLMLQHASSFKVGIKRGVLDLYDFTLLETDEKDIKYLFGHLLFYLQSIGTK